MIDLKGVQVDVLDSQDHNIPEGLNEEELKLVTQLHATLTGHPEFKEKWPDATLSRVEVHRDFALDKQGKVYLRYEVPGQVPQEFWGKAGKAARVNVKTGRITVQV